MIKTIVRAIFGLIAIGASLVGMFLLLTSTRTLGSINGVPLSAPNSDQLLSGIGWLLFAIFIQLLLVNDRLSDQAKLRDSIENIQSMVGRIGRLLQGDGQRTR